MGRGNNRGEITTRLHDIAADSSSMGRVLLLLRTGFQKSRIDRRAWPNILTNETICQLDFQREQQCGVQ
jgi:hypothetical protein